MQIPFFLEFFDLAGFSVWLRKHGATIHRAIPDSACVISFEIRTHRRRSTGSVWTYDGQIAYNGAARINYALYLLRSKPQLDLKNAQPFTPDSPLYDIRYNSRKKKSIRIRVLLRDGDLCYYCGEAMHKNDTTLEHLIARSHGGKTTMENIVLAHSFCNNKAGTLPYEQKVALRGQIRRNPNTAAR